MILSILICSLWKRAGDFARLLNVLDQQLTNEVEILTDVDNGEVTTGVKRNRLLQKAKGKYVVFIDDDDLVPHYYIEEILKASKSDADCFAINGTITTDGKNERKWYISKDLPYKESLENGNKIYLRYPNHITTIKREIAQQFLFPDKVHGEDYDWATQLHKSGLIKTEFKIEKPMYYYLYKSSK